MMITPVFAGILTLVYVHLSSRVILARRSNGIGLGDGGNVDLMRRMRVHSNFSEYVPLGLLLMALAELQDVPVWMLILIGIVLLAGRSVHAVGLGSAKETLVFRTMGMALTLSALVAGALVNMTWPWL